MEHLKLELMIINWWNVHKERQIGKPGFVIVAEERITQYNDWVNSNVIESQVVDFLKIERHWRSLIPNCDIILSQYLRGPHITAHEYLKSKNQKPEEQICTMLYNFQKYFDNLGR